jgi:hypothetical protein
VYVQLQNDTEQKNKNSAYASDKHILDTFKPKLYTSVPFGADSLMDVEV